MKLINNFFVQTFVRTMFSCKSIISPYILPIKILTTARDADSYPVTICVFREESRLDTIVDYGARGVLGRVEIASRALHSIQDIFSLKKSNLTLK